MSFDFEIFPDGTCPSYNDCGYNHANLPDFEFSAGNGPIGSGSLVTAFGTNGVARGVMPGTTDGTLKHSPDSGSGSEYAPQYIGVSGALSLSNVGDLNFIDWPATIGIDNLQISYDPAVPEPGSVFLVAPLIGFLLYKRVRRTA